MTKQSKGTKEQKVIKIPAPNVFGNTPIYFHKKGVFVIKQPKVSEDSKQNTGGSKPDGQGGGGIRFSVGKVQIGEDTSPDWQVKLERLFTRPWTSKEIKDFIASELSKVEKKAYTLGKKEALKEVGKRWDTIIELEKLKKKI